MLKLALAAVLAVVPITLVWVGAAYQEADRARREAESRLDAVATRLELAETELAESRASDRASREVRYELRRRVAALESSFVPRAEGPPLELLPMEPIARVGLIAEEDLSESERERVGDSQSDVTRLYYRLADGRLFRVRLSRRPASPDEEQLVAEKVEHEIIEQDELYEYCEAALDRGHYERFPSLKEAFAGRAPEQAWNTFTVRVFPDGEVAGIDLQEFRDSRPQNPDLAEALRDAGLFGIQVDPVR